MTDVKEQRICIKFCFKLSKMASEPQPKMWQKFDTEGMVHKECVPPGQMVNGKFYCDVLRQLRAKNLAQTFIKVALQLLGPAL